MQEVINLVDKGGKRIGSMEKIEAHKRAVLHEAFSIFVFDSDGRLLLQRRALGKYHSGGLWTNTCCSHARVGEDLTEAVNRRLQEEMGFKTKLQEVYQFTYKVNFDNGLSEHEYDHVFVGRYIGPVNPDPEEVADFKWISKEELLQDINVHPEHYTYWMNEIFRDAKILQYFDA